MDKTDQKTNVAAEANLGNRTSIQNIVDFIFTPSNLVSLICYVDMNLLTEVGLETLGKFLQNFLQWISLLPAHRYFRQYVFGTHWYVVGESMVEFAPFSKA